MQGLKGKLQLLGGFFIDEFSRAISVHSPGSEDSLDFWLGLDVDGSGWLNVDSFRLAGGLALVHHHEEKKQLVVTRVVHKKERKHHVGSESGVWCLRLHCHHKNEHVHGTVVGAVVVHKKKGKHHVEIIVEALLGIQTTSHRVEEDHKKNAVC